MDKLNQYQKIQIILLVSIIIAATVLAMSFIKNKNIKNYGTEQTFSDLTSEIEEQSDENMITEETTANEENEEDTSWDEEAEDTKVENEDEKNNENEGIKYYLKVNYTANVVTAYTRDESGKYTVPAKAMLCSTGTATPTSGVYKMSNKYRWHQLNGGVYGQYCSRITGHILFHSVPYKTNSPDTLKYAAYDKLGTKASAGCIRLTVADAMWIYSNCPSGTYVEFYSSSNPGPLGKPTAQKISSNEKCRNWDPTDPISSNPWHGYVEEASAPAEQPKKDNENNNQSENQNNEQDKPIDNNNNDKDDENKDDNNNNNNNDSSKDENNKEDEEDKKDEDENNKGDGNKDDDKVPEPEPKPGEDEKDKETEGNGTSGENNN